MGWVGNPFGEHRPPFQVLSSQCPPLPSYAMANSPLDRAWFLGAVSAVAVVITLTAGVLSGPPWPHLANYVPPASIRKTISVVAATSSLGAAKESRQMGPWATASTPQQQAMEADLADRDARWNVLAQCRALMAPLGAALLAVAAVLALVRHAHLQLAVFATTGKFEWSSGTVKEFDRKVAQGWICPVDGGENVFVQRNALREKGLGLVTGAMVEYTAIRKYGRIEADQVLYRHEGVVRWFDSEKGFGFIRPIGGGQDVFVHQKGVLYSGPGGPTEGSTVEYTLIKMDDGSTRAFHVVEEDPPV